MAISSRFFLFFHGTWKHVHRDRDICGFPWAIHTTWSMALTLPEWLGVLNLTKRIYSYFRLIGVHVM